jgi:ssDNA-binding Zn-finger/Zn-ribbon topoisomerase 1
MGNVPRNLDVCSHCAAPRGRVLSAATRRWIGCGGNETRQAEYFPKSLNEPVAQPVEQLTFNQ